MTDPMNLTLEEFDALTCDHVFSESYRRRKLALVRSLDGRPRAEGRGGGAPVRSRRMTRAVAAAAIAAVIALPAIAIAASDHGSFFHNAFGTGWRTSTPATQGVQRFDEPDKADAVFTYPAEEFVDVDPQTAEALVGASVMDEPLQVESADGHVLTITGAVRSEHAMVYQFTLAREGEQTALAYSEATNRGKGAMTGEDARFGWTVGGDEFVYVDLDRSTPELVSGYGYTVFGKALAEGEEPQLTLWDYNMPMSEAYGEPRRIDELDVRERTVAIPCTKALPATTFTNAEGGTVEISALGITLDNETGLFASAAPGDYSMAADPYWTFAVSLHFADGGSYTVYDTRADLDNTASLCCFDRMIDLAFNRLVDPAQVERIDVVVADGDDPDGFLVDGEWPPIDQIPTRTVSYMRR